MLSWLMIISLESLSGIVRETLLIAVFGPNATRRLGFAVGCLVILLVALWTSNWLQMCSQAERIYVGIVWAVLTILFDVSLARILGFPWERISADFNPFQGGLMGIGILYLISAPSLAHTLRKSNKFRSD